MCRTRPRARAHPVSGQNRGGVKNRPLLAILGHFWQSGPVFANLGHFWQSGPLLGNPGPGGQIRSGGQIWVRGAVRKRCGRSTFLSRPETYAKGCCSSEHVHSIKCSLRTSLKNRGIKCCSMECGPCRNSKFQNVKRSDNLDINKSIQPSRRSWCCPQCVFDLRSRHAVLDPIKVVKSALYPIISSKVQLKEDISTAFHI